MPSTSLSERKLPGKGGSVLGMRCPKRGAASQGVPAGRSQQAVKLAACSKAAVGRPGTFDRVLPLNHAAHPDARTSAVLHKVHRARAGGRER